MDEIEKKVFCHIRYSLDVDNKILNISDITKWIKVNDDRVKKAIFALMDEGFIRKSMTAERPTLTAVGKNCNPDYI